ncbi:Spo0E family sporulation regulatory protein-aspartic acid phosphatase [Thalassobacillus pellis]|uniref:Spo0E family sporulation regulatory protein-aspartic acid phosphatase n=1 Tax=Thalassobacillus pellis TaxID=748008 RepID=UPI003B82EDC3
MINNPAIGYRNIHGGVSINTQQLEIRIEQLRQKMHLLYSEDPNNLQVIQVSQSLDELINEYHRRTWSKRKRKTEILS